MNEFVEKHGHVLGWHARRERMIGARMVWLTFVAIGAFAIDPSANLVRHFFAWSHSPFFTRCDLPVQAIASTLQSSP